MQALRFHKFCPGGNPTILVSDPDALVAALDGARRASMAAALMSPLHLGAEQVGFVRLDAAPRLDMMGGEFCVNASRSAAMLLAQEGLLAKEEDGWSGLLSASGADEPLALRVRRVPGTDDGAALLDCAVRVPLPEKSTRLERPEDGIALARLPGITHLLLDTDLFPMPVNWLEGAAFWRERFGLDEEEAAGVVWHERLANGAPGIHPAVRVRNTGSVHMESACGSGSLALALLLGGAQRGGELLIRQPSGQDLSVAFDGAPSLFSAAWVGGPVSLVAEGNAYLS